MSFELRQGAPTPLCTTHVGGTVPGLQVVLGAALYITAQVAAAIVALPVILAASGTEDVLGALVTHPVGSTVFFLVYAVLSLAGYFVLTAVFSPRDRVTTFGSRAAIARETRRGALFGGAVMTAAVLILATNGIYHGEDLRLDAGIIAGTVMGVGAACGEEVFFRGVLFRVINARLGSTCAVIGVGAVFGLLHAGNPGAGLIGGLAIVLTAGLMLNVAYLLHDRIWMPIGIHFAWNAVQAGVFGITVSGTETGRGLWAGTLTGPDWLSGGSMGIEGSVVTIVLGLLGGAWLTARCVRRGNWRSFRDARREVSQIERIGQGPANG